MTTVLIRRNAPNDSCHNLTALMSRCTKTSLIITPHYICAHRNSDNVHNAAFIGYSAVGEWRTCTFWWSYARPTFPPEYTRRRCHHRCRSLFEHLRVLCDIDLCTNQPQFTASICQAEELLETAQCRKAKCFQQTSINAFFRKW